MIAVFLSRIIVTFCGVILPAYKTYKALKNKNVPNLVVLSMHWIVMSCFIAIETITDIFLTWLPLYYESKVFLVLYLVMPFTQGSSLVYRKIIHPHLCKNESEIDEVIERATETGYSAMLKFGAKSLTFAASTVITTAMKSQDLIANQLNQRSLSLNDLVYNATNERYKQSNKSLAAGDVSTGQISNHPTTCLSDVIEQDGEDKADMPIPTKISHNRLRTRTDKQYNRSHSDITGFVTSSSVLFTPTMSVSAIRFPLPRSPNPVTTFSLTRLSCTSTKLENK